MQRAQNERYRYQRTDSDHRDRIDRDRAAKSDAADQHRARFVGARPLAFRLAEFVPDASNE
jgi:hypothetical protein